MPTKKKRVPTVRFELIDRVIEHDETHLVACKNVTAAEEYLGDHFPGFPVLPGVMMLEVLVQAGRALVGKIETAPLAAPLIVDQVRNIRYGNMVRPGETLQVEVTLKETDRDGDSPKWEFTGVGKVNEQVAVQGKFRLTPLGAED